jgi:DNA-binding transcriptional MocR family regulator
MGAASLARLMGGWQSESGRAPAYRQIEQALRLLILDGRLPIGIRLPGERTLAPELGVSRTTIAAAYAGLREHGFLASRHGSGSITRVPRGKPVDGPDAIGTAGIDFAIAALPAPKEVHAAYSEALAELPHYLPGTGYEPAGIEDLRASIANRYAERDLPTSADEILVTQGAQHGLVMAIALLARPGDRIVVDHPTYSKALEAIRNASCQAVPVQLPQRGWDVDQVEAAIRQTGSKLAFLIPDFHNPTGRCMGSAERSRVAALAASAGCTLIIDETMAELWIDRLPPPPFAAFDPAGMVITLGSMSKSFWGGLRVGWMRASRETIAALAVSRASMDMGSPIVEQLAAAFLLRQSSEMLDGRRAELRTQRNHLLALIAERFPDWKVEPPSGGLSAWVELPVPVGTALAAAAHDLGLRIAAGTRFGIDGAFDRFVRLPYSLPVPVLTDAVDRLEAAWDRVARRGHRRRFGPPPAELIGAI